MSATRKVVAAHLGTSCAVYIEDDTDRTPRFTISVVGEAGVTVAAHAADEDRARTLARALFVRHEPGSSGRQ